MIKFNNLPKSDQELGYIIFTISDNSLDFGTYRWNACDAPGWRGSWSC